MSDAIDRNLQAAQSVSRLLKKAGLFSCSLRRDNSDRLRSRSRLQTLDGDSRQLARSIFEISTWLSTRRSRCSPTPCIKRRIGIASSPSAMPEMINEAVVALSS